MGHAEIHNRTPFAFAHLFLADEEARPLLVVLVQATYEIRDGEPPVPAEEQPPVALRGQRWDDDERSTHRIEPPLAFTKLATDVVLVGHAWAPRSGAVESEVVFRAGALERRLRVVGDRVFTRAAGAVAPSPALPFEKIPLRYERAFGGWDRSDPDRSRHACEDRNPAGTGFRKPGSAFVEGVRLPNLEDPGMPLTRWGQVVPPAGVGFVAPGWQPRAAFTGTCDEAWSRDRRPLLPVDFDRRFFSAASPGLTAPGFLAGGEPVVVLGASPGQRLAFDLPRLRRPACRVALRHGDDAWIAARPDTVIVDADTSRLVVLFRGHLALRRGPHDVRGVEVGAMPPKGASIAAEAGA